MNDQLETLNSQQRIVSLETAASNDTQQAQSTDHDGHIQEQEENNTKEEDNAVLVAGQSDSHKGTVTQLDDATANESHDDKDTNSSAPIFSMDPDTLVQELQNRQKQLEDSQKQVATLQNEAQTWKEKTKSQQARIDELSSLLNEVLQDVRKVWDLVDDNLKVWALEESDFAKPDEFLLSLFQDFLQKGKTDTVLEMLCIVDRSEFDPDSKLGLELQALCVAALSREAGGDTALVDELRKHIGLDE